MVIQQELPRLKAAVLSGVFLENTCAVLGAESNLAL